MTKGSKIAIGCVAAGTVVVGLVVVSFFGLAWWGKNKLEETMGPGGFEAVAEAAQETQRYRTEANKNAFTRPEDQRIEEERLLQFLAVRRDVYGVYEQHRDMLEPSKKPEAGFAMVGRMSRAITQIQLARARAQARESMSDAEYTFFLEQVYRSLWADQVAQATGGKTFSQAADAAMDAGRVNMKQALENPQLTEEAREKLRESLAQMEKSSREASSQAKALEVPAENAALFRKHKADIEKYTMKGLAVVGL